MTREQLDINDMLIHAFRMSSDQKLRSIAAIMRREARRHRRAMARLQNIQDFMEVLERPFRESEME